jgi:hypothetical protein
VPLVVGEGMIDQKAAITLVEPGHVDQLFHPQFKVRRCNSNRCNPC